LKPLKPKIILGIETSCDDTSVCLLESFGDSCKILSLNSYNQDFLLSKWGGVVPELAARSHVKAIPPLLQISFKEAHLSAHEVDEVAVTTHPGLIGPLLTGINLAKTFALFLQKPITPVNHLYAHLEAIHLTNPTTYPYLGLLVSGGHSAFFWATGPDKMELIGSTLDDAAGEAFDKGGKLLGVGYPAGRIIDEISQKGELGKFNFPISYMRERPGKMSFSGLKTALRVKLERMDLKDKESSLADICANYQEAIVQTLRIKTQEVIEKVLGHHLKNFKFPIVVGGGVACNSRLRIVMQQHFNQVLFVNPLYCTDNGAMIAHYAARVPHHSLVFPDCLSIDAKGRYVEKNSGERLNE
jgi:N6-L-threonylcarbamoyladenine synthase